MELVLYTNPMSRGRIACWMLEETGEPYRVEVIGYGAEMKGPQFRAINPMGKVPALMHGKTVVTECAGIIAYLADAFPQAGLLPETPEERGAYYRWMFFAAGPVEAAVTNRNLGIEVPADKRRMVGYDTYETVMDTLEALLSRTPYITGDRFTAADVYLGSQISWGLQFGTIDRRPAFADYAARVVTRPAWSRANDLDNALARDMAPPAGT